MAETANPFAPTERFDLGAHGRELTSNFIADYADEFRVVPGSPLLPADAWQSVLAECREPTVFVTRPISLGFVIATVLIIIVMLAPAVKARRAAITG